MNTYVTLAGRAAQVSRIFAGGLSLLGLIGSSGESPIPTYARLGLFWSSFLNRFLSDSHQTRDLFWTRVVRDGMNSKVLC